MSSSSQLPNERDVTPVINLSEAPGERSSWDRPLFHVYAWSITELLFVYNPWQVSSRLRTGALRLFGAEIGSGVIMRPRTRVRFPWKLHIGDRSWIGEGVWFHNQDHIYIGHDAVVSQETFLTTGSHAYKTDMALITRPINIGDGAWITARCIILGGANIGRSAVIKPGSLIGRSVAPNTVVSGDDDESAAPRFNRNTEDNHENDK